jgi:hypothetical protein
MKILILSNYPWEKTNSFGNTYSSIFGKVSNTEIAHIYMFDGQPDSEANITAYYQIPEREVMSTFFRRRRGQGAGRIIEPKQNQIEEKSVPKEESASLYKKILSFGKRSHSSLLFMAREFVWKHGHVNYDGLIDFVKSFQPDLFFLPYSNTYYTNRIALYIKEHYDVPLVVEMAMDHYSLNRVSWNPLFWIDRFGKRRIIRKLADKSEMFYAISKKLKEEIEHDLGVPCKVLYKTPDKTRMMSPYTQAKINKVRFLFTGNIYANRWRSLALLASELKRQQFGHLDIYTASPITRAIDKALNVDGFSSIHPPVSQEEVIKLQNEADVLVHVEAFDRYNKSLVRCAISTKIMDYLSAGRCILAIGPSDISSVEYLSDNGLALIANSKQGLNDQVSRIRGNLDVLTEYAGRCQDFVHCHLDEDALRESFYDGLQLIVEHYRETNVANNN